MRFRCYLLCSLGFLLCAGALCGREVDALIQPFRFITINAPVRGAISSMEVREGDAVSQGHVLARLDAELEELEVDRTAKIYERKQFDNEGTAQLFADKMTSADEALEKRIEADIAKIDNDKALRELERRLIRAPMAGIVTNRMMEEGEWVESGDPIFEMVSMDQVYAEMLLDAIDSFSLKKGQTLSVRIPVSEGEDVFEGKIEYIAPVVDASSGLVRIKILLPNADHRIRPGLRGKVILP